LEDDDPKLRLAQAYLSKEVQALLLASFFGYGVYNELTKSVQGLILSQVSNCNCSRVVV
jgi:hypothetical protein